MACLAGTAVVGVTGIDGRLSRLSSALTAKERALLVLRSWKEDRDEDSAWRYRMPDQQVSEFNRYIRLMNGVNRNLGPLLLHLEATVEMLSLRLGWLTTFMFWQWNTAQLVEYIQRETNEPVTESEYRELERKAREEYKPADELAELLVERHEGWSEEDLDPDQGDDPHDDVIVSPKSWARVRAEKKREIAALVKEGALPGRGKGKGLLVQVGPFYDRLGEPVPVEPEWAMAYDVRPDDQAGEVKAHRYWREQAREAYRRGPTAPIPYLPDLELDTGEPSQIDEIVDVHKKLLRSGVVDQWRLLGAVEQNIGEVAAQFDGEDPAIPELRHVLDHSKERLIDLHKETQRYTGPFELAEPDEEELAWVREIMGREPP